MSPFFMGYLKMNMQFMFYADYTIKTQKIYEILKTTWQHNKTYVL